MSRKRRQRHIVPHARCMNRPLFELGLRSGLRLFDRDAGLCLYTPDRKPGFQKRIHDDAQSSVLTAAGLLARGGRGDTETAAQILQALIDTEPSWNAGFRLFLLGWTAHDLSPSRLERLPRIRALLGEALAGAASVILARKPGAVHRPGYTNFWLLDLVGLILAGQFLNDPHLVQRGSAMLQQFATHQEPFDAPEEFNSPAYLPAQLAALTALRRFACDQPVSLQALKLEIWLWKHFLRHYDPEAGVITGPWSRAYPADRRGEQPFVRLLTAGAWNDAAGWSWIRDADRHSHPLLVWGVLFARLRTNVSPIGLHFLQRDILATPSRSETLPPGAVGGRSAVRLWHEQSNSGLLTMASQSAWHLWEQSVPVSAHHLGQSTPLVYQDRSGSRHTGTRFTAVQKDNEVLAGFAYLATGPRTSLDFGLTRGLPEATESPCEELHIPSVDQRLRLYLDGRPAILQSQPLPTGVPLVLASRGWAIGLIAGLHQPKALAARRATATGLSLAHSPTDVTIQFRPVPEQARLVPGVQDGPYGWYYLCLQETPDRAALADMLAHMAAVRVTDAASGRRRRVQTGGTAATMELTIDPAVREARIWTSNGWQTYPIQEEANTTKG